jgi:hypothetical protein
MIEALILFCGVMSCFALGYILGRMEGRAKGFDEGSANAIAYMQSRQMMVQAMRRKREVPLIKPPSNLLSQLG